MRSTRTEKGATNPNYREGPDLVIGRLRDAGFLIVDALLDTDTVLTGAAAQTGRESGAKGAGNPERRLRIVVARADARPMHPEQLAARLEGIR